MGLDMYLTGKMYIGGQFEHREVQAKMDIEVRGAKLLIPPLELYPLEYLEFHLFYWRKANAIHRWFVDNCQNGIDECQTAYVDWSALQELHNICSALMEKMILADGVVQNGSHAGPDTGGKMVPNYETGQYIANPEICQKLLPTGSGCFFGSTDYDQWYYRDIERTYEMLDNLVRNDCEFLKKYGLDVYYHSSW